MSSDRQRLSFTDRLLVAIVAWIGPVLLKLLGSTWRVRLVNADVEDRVWSSGRGVIYAFWHGLLLPLGFLRRGCNIQVLASLHRDGEMIARVMTAMGYGIVRGSSRRGSARGLLGMLERAREGLTLAITPDGPTGPAGVVKQGIFYLAEKSGSALVPVGVGASRAKRMDSWDAFMIPVPFTCVAVVYGEPLEWNESADFEEKASALKSELDRLTKEAQELADQASAPT